MIYPQIVAQSIIGYWTGQPRSSHWPATRRNYLLRHPSCEACCTKLRLEVHHKVPFYVDKSLELVEANLLTLCRDCHFMLGHLKDWSKYNPHIDSDAATYRARITEFDEKYKVK